MKHKIANAIHDVCKSYTRAVLFGSVIVSNSPNDIDIIFVYSQKDYGELQKQLMRLQDEIAVFLNHVPLHITLLNEKEALVFPFDLLGESKIDIMLMK